MKRLRRERALVSFLALSLALAGCPLADVSIDDDVVITCAAADECPSGYSCVERVGRCIVDSGGDEQAPALSGATLSRDRAGAGVEVVLTFDVDEPLFEDPRVTLGGADAFTRDADHPGFRYTLVPTGGEGSGTHTVQVDLVDLSGNEALGVAAGSVTLDFEPPAVAAAAVSDDVVAGGAELTLTVTASEPLVEPAVALLDAAAPGTEPITLTATGGAAGDTTFSFRWTHDGSETNHVPYSLRLQMRDEADNVVDVEPGVIVSFDDEPPVIEEGSASVVITGLVLSQVLGAAPLGGRVAVQLTVSEDLVTAPIVSAGPYSFTLAGVSGRTYRYELLVGVQGAEGEHAVRVELTDPAGNTSVLDDVVRFIVDRTAPEPPDVDTLGSVVLRRVPYGDGEGTGPSFTVRTAAGAVEPRSFVIVFPTAGASIPLGGGRSDEEGVAEIQLVAFDIPRVFVQAADDAGNRSAAVRVRDVEWLGTLADEPGAPTLEARRVFDGGLFGGDGISLTAGATVADDVAATTVGAGRWLLVGTSGAPAGRQDVAAAYDAQRGVAVLFGGQLQFGASCDDSGFFYCGGTWEWSPSGFTRVMPSDPEGDGDPTPRFGHAMAYDTLRARTVLFGGKDSSNECDGDVTSFCGGTWSWNGSSWRRLDEGDVRPAPRVQAAMAYDIARDRLVLYGGTSTSDDEVDCAGGQLCFDTLEHDGVEWHDVTFDLSGAPLPRTAAAMAYDEERGVTVLFGGIRATGQATDETWEYDGASWTQVTTSAAPDPRFGHGMAFSRQLGRVVAFGGKRTPGESCEGGTSLLCSGLWAYDGAGAWERIDVEKGPAARSGAAFAYGDALGGLTAFMGESPPSTPCPDGSSAIGSCRLADVWTFSGNGGWRARGPLDPEADGHPAPRESAGLVVVPSTGRLLVAGGERGGCPAGACADTWRLEDMSWSLVDDATTPAGATGALVGWPGGGVARLGDLSATLSDGAGPFLWDGAAWSEAALPAGASPDARTRYAAAYDPVRDVTLVFGGLVARAEPCPAGSFPYDAASCVTSETWELRDTGWTEITGTLPPPRVDAALAYDEESGAVMLFGGRRCVELGEDPGCDSALDFEFFGDTWRYQDGAWTQASSSGPPARAEHSMAFDPGRRRVVLFGGGASALFNCGTASRLCRDVWEWNGSEWQEQVPAITTSGAPTGRLHAGFAKDERHQAVALFGGSGGIGDTWRWDGGATTRPAHVVHQSLAAIGALGAIVTSLRATFIGGASSGNVDGAALLVWGGGAFRLAALSTSPADDPAAISVVETRARALAGALGAHEGSGVHVALVPLGPNGTGERARVATDHVEIEVHYRLP